jgi:hypothetical protein
MRRLYPQPSRRAPLRAGAAVLVGLVLVTGAARATPVPGEGGAVGRVGRITVTAGSLRPAPFDTWTTPLQLSTGGPASDQLDAALAAGGAPVAVFHQRVSVGEIPDLASCDGDIPPPQLVAQWLHYGPLLVPGRTGGPVPLATATLTLPRAGVVATAGKVAITLYFAGAGQLTLDLPVEQG